MIFVETPIFTRRIHGTLKDEEYRALQAALLRRLEQGSLIPGSGGLRVVAIVLSTIGTVRVKPSTCCSFTQKASGKISHTIRSRCLGKLFGRNLDERG